MRFDDPLRDFVTAVQQTSGAIAVSLYLEGQGQGTESGLLLHAGAATPLPEFGSSERARTFIAQAAAALPDTGRLECVPGSGTDRCILRLPLAWAAPEGAPLPGATPLPGRRKNDRAGSDSDELPTLWLGLRYDDGAAPKADTEVPFDPRAADGSVLNWPQWALLTAGLAAWKSFRLIRQLLDPTSGLPGRVELQLQLREAVEEATRRGRSIALLLVNPDEFALVNHRVGRSQGDEALRQIGQRMQAALRDGDAVFRYGGAVLAAVIPDAAIGDLLGVAEKLRRTLTQKAYLDGEVRLSFSVGGVAAGPIELTTGNVDGNILLHRADQALNTARLSGGSRTLVWKPDGQSQASGNLDRLSGVFTADTEKDYRNMLLLWETVTVISGNADSKALAGAFMKRLREALSLGRASLFAQPEEGEPVLLAMVDGRSPDEVITEQPRQHRLTEPQLALVERARTRKATERSVNPRAGEGGESPAETHVVPLFARARYLGFVLLQSAPNAAHLDSSDLLFLEALARQIAVALDRAQLAEERQRQHDLERQQLRAEVRGLRDALQHASFIYDSAPMRALVKLLEQVAPTEATVLITGESGTGKEVVARSLHELSHRRQKPFVTVDCGAIAHSLLETELFGHVKGAYTGADARSPGRIVLAEGGTLFLDEIGELPLEVQAKLLRVVQEREITPVGGSGTRSIDVRIIAATNRDLEAEVAQGRFRSDLYYRLQVVTLKVPALRERRDDILPLAQFFLEKFAMQYQKVGLSFNDAARQALLVYDWPGNVRELQNRIFQAVVLSADSVIDAVGVAPLNGGSPLADAAESESKLGRAPTETTELAQPATAAPSPGNGAAASDQWGALREALREHVDNALSLGRHGVVPLGRWLNEDLVLAADDLSEGVAAAASARLGMADTTFRRQREKLRAEVTAGLLARTPGWRAVQPLLARLVAEGGEPDDTNVTKQARNLLLEEVVSRVNGNAALGSKLMGVTVPTFRRWVDECTDRSPSVP